MTNKKIRIAWFSSDSNFQDSFSVSYWFTKQIYSFLTENFEVDFYSKQDIEKEGIKFTNYRKARVNHKTNPYDLFFYNLEDNDELSFIRMHIVQIPGIVYFHDFIHSNYGPIPMVNSAWHLNCENYNQSKFISYERLDEKYQKIPHAHRESAYSLISLLSSAAFNVDFSNVIKDQIKFNTDKRNIYFPTAASEKFYNIKPKENELLNIAFSGCSQFDSRSHKFLPVLEKFNDKIMFHWMLDKKFEGHANKLLSENNITNFKIYNSKSENTWYDILLESDLVLHTKFSFYKNISPFLEMSLAAGKYIITNNFHFADYIPETAAFKVNVGSKESLEYDSIINKFINIKKIGTNIVAREFAQSFYNKDINFNFLKNLIIKNLDSFKKHNALWADFEKQASQSLLNEMKSYVGNIGLDIIDPIFKEFDWNE